MRRRVLLLERLATLGVGGVKLTGADFVGTESEPVALSETLPVIGVPGLASATVGGVQSAAAANWLPALPLELPKGADIQTENGGATAGRAEPGDKLHLTYSETMRPSSILPGWDGSPTSATVRFIDGATDKLEIYDGANTTRLELIASTRHILLRGDYVPASGATFTATMVRNGPTLTVTLGTLTAGGVNSSLGVAATMEWPPSRNATDLAGNGCETTLVLELIIEGGVLDAEF